MSFQAHALILSVVAPPPSMAQDVCTTCAWHSWLNGAAAGEAMREYIKATVPLTAFGEYWDTCEYTDGVLNYNQDSHRQRTVNWCDKTGGTAAAFDFTTKGGFRPDRHLLSLLRRVVVHNLRHRTLSNTVPACDTSKAAFQSYRDHLS